VHEEGCKVFLDLKFHDIPNTVARASAAATALGVFMFNVHCSGGSLMMKTAVEAARREADSRGIAPPLLLGVTVLTSMSQETLAQDVGIPDTPENTVVRWAEMAKQCGIGGVVASPREAALIRQHCGKDFTIVTPGIRPAGSESDDQIRIKTPEAAIKMGADYLVIGRPVTQAPDPLHAFKSIVCCHKNRSPGCPVSKSLENGEW
jgi:orotidine-5'-phosphate decarboxylase